MIVLTRNKSGPEMIVLARNKPGPESLCIRRTVIPDKCAIRLSWQ